MAKPIIVVTGATGRQGSALLRQMDRTRWQPRAISRNPDAPRARALTAMGIEVVRGDLNDPESLRPALDGAYGVFSVQDYWEHGFDGEVRQGKNLADVANAAGVRHFVYTSVGAAERDPGVRHYQSKWEIEQHIRALGLPATILRPAFFMEMFRDRKFPPFFIWGLLTGMMRKGGTVQMVAVDDIAAFALKAFDNPQDWMGKAVELAGDELTMAEALAVFRRVTGRTPPHVPMPIAPVAWFSRELRANVHFMNDLGWKADIAALRTLHPELRTLEAWVGEHS